jgi:uncharacterized protein with HEPN domain
MRPPRRPGRGRHLLLQDIVAWSARLAGHLDGVTIESFPSAPLVQDAVIRCVHVVGEAAGRLLAEPLGPALEPLRPGLRAAV